MPGLDDRRERLLRRRLRRRAAWPTSRETEGYDHRLAAPLLASQGCDRVGRVLMPGRPGRGLIYRLSRRPALAEIVGDGRP